MHYATRLWSLNCTKCGPDRPKNGGDPAGSPPGPLDSISRPVSRVLSARGKAPSPDGHSSATLVTQRLEQPTRTARSGHWSRASLRSRGGESRAVPIRSCSRWGLPCRLRCRRRGALLPHRFTLTAHASREGTLRAAVCSLWHFPWA